MDTDVPPVSFSGAGQHSDHKEKRPANIMAAGIAAHPGKAAMYIPAVQIEVDHVQHIGAPKAVA